MIDGRTLLIIDRLLRDLHRDPDPIILTLASLPPSVLRQTCRKVVQSGSPLERLPSSATCATASHSDADRARDGEALHVVAGVRTDEAQSQYERLTCRQ